MTHITNAQNEPMSEQDAIQTLKEGGVGIFPTDTLYGIVALAHNAGAVDHVYDLKGRKEDKPCIILIPNENALDLFEVQISDEEKRVLALLWPGCISCIVSCPSESYAYLHKETRSLAFRVPAEKWLIQVLNEVGPLIAPSANPETLEPAKNIARARDYFQDNVDVYWDGGELNSSPSTLIKLEKGCIIVKREGVISAKEIQGKLKENNIHIPVILS